MRRAALFILLLFAASPVWAATKTYTDPRHLYSIDYPDGWRMKEAPVISFLSPFESRKDPFAENVSVQIEDLSRASGGMSLLDYHRQSMGNAPADLQDFKVLEEARTEFLGHAAIAVLYTATVNGKRFKFKDYKLMLGKDAYVLTYTALSADYDKYLPAAEKVMHSLRASP